MLLAQGAAFDDLFRQARREAETVTAELTVTQPREIAQYGRAFDMLAARSVTGPAARVLIGAEIDRWRAWPGA